jgi:hypothetical protein
LHRYAIDLQASNRQEVVDIKDLQRGWTERRERKEKQTLIRADNDWGLRWRGRRRGGGGFKRASTGAGADV